MASERVNGPFVGMYSLKPYYNSSDPVELPDCMYKLANIHHRTDEMKAPWYKQQLRTESMTSQKVNGPFTGMYSLKPYCNSSDPVELPDCMYKVASIHRSAGEVKDAGGESLPPEVAALEKKQEAILVRLAALKAEVERLGAAEQSTSVTSKTVQQPISEGGVIEDLVINASPASPPLSVLVLKDLLSQQYRILSKCHIHSSAGMVRENLRAVFGNGTTCSRSGYQLGCTLIWKKTKSGPSLVVNPQVQSVIVGEANIARYLARLLKPAYDSGTDIATATEIDQFVDMSYPLTWGSAKEKAAVLKTLNAKLGKAEWLVGSTLSLADISLWSAIQQSGQAEGVSANIKKWLANCNQHPAFQSALKVIQA